MDVKVVVVFSCHTCTSAFIRMQPRAMALPSSTMRQLPLIGLGIVSRSAQFMDFTDSCSGFVCPTEKKCKEVLHWYLITPYRPRKGIHVDQLGLSVSLLHGSLQGVFFAPMFWSFEEFLLVLCVLIMAPTSMYMHARFTCFVALCLCSMVQS